MCICNLIFKTTPFLEFIAFGIRVNVVREIEFLPTYLYMQVKNCANLAVDFNRMHVKYSSETLYEVVSICCEFPAYLFACLAFLISGNNKITDIIFFICKQIFYL